MPRQSRTQQLSRDWNDHGLRATQALEAGINFFDTANVYSDGTSEEIVGRALKRLRRATRS
jgi:aryl-alcohol dehydrogenase-like predicted oxidoreductase